MTGAPIAGGILLLATCLTGSLVGYAISSVDRIRLLEMLTTPGVILVLLAINLVIGVIRVVAASDAWRRAGGHAFGVGILALLTFTAIPHVALGYVGLETRSTILSVFSQPTGPAVIAVATTTSSTTTTTVPESPTLLPLREIPIDPTTSTTTTTTLPLGAERVTFLLLGGDAGPGRPGNRTDTIMVATIDTRTGDAAIFGLPRNLAGFTFSDGTEFTGLTKGILNEVYMWGERNPERFPGPEPGVAAVRDVAATLLGLPIDHYVMVDMIGFARLVDVIGGVDVNVKKPMAAPLYDRSTGGFEMIEIPAGNQHLNGDLALAYARSRTGSSDYSRMARQRCLLSSVVDQAGPLTMMMRLPSLLDVVKNSVSTDISLNELPYLINLAPRVSGDRTTVVGFDLEYRSGEVTASGFYKPDVERIQSVVRQAVSGDWEGGPVDLLTATEACG